MKSKSRTKQIKDWREGIVDTIKPHFELRFGSVDNGYWDDWLPVALLGEPKEGIINVKILFDKSELKNKKIIKKMIKDIEFYLIYKNEPDPWEYAIYHCGSMANAYSDVHWSYFNSGA